jgi:hypothetical protein
MDIEKTKKINELVAELKKHKMLEGSDDALTKAEEMVNRSGDESLSSAPTARPEAHSNAGFETILKEHAKVMKEELDLLRKGLLSINDEVQELREKMTEMERNMAQLKRAEPKVEKPAEAPEAEPKEETPAPAEKEKSGESHPRQGNFNEDDVSIEKIFYAGKK